MECKFRQRIFAKSNCFEASPEIPLYRSFLEHSSPRSAELSSRGELVKSSSEVSTKLISAGSEDDFRKATPNRVIEIRSVILNSSTPSTETKVGGHPKFTVHIATFPPVCVCLTALVVKMEGKRHKHVAESQFRVVSLGQSRMYPKKYSNISQKNNSGC